MLFQQAVDDLMVDGDGAGARVTGVITQMGLRFEADAVILTTGTFLSGLIHVGLENYEAGRAGDPPAKTLGARLRELRLPAGRLKTGTPPRLDGRTIDFAALSVQPGDDPAPVFSFVGTREMHPRQVPCWITHTNERTHDIIRGGLDRSPLFTGVIKGVGPRYCPSIEDKVVRFADRKSHQIFLEPEGLSTNEIYPNGISTSLPFDVQVALVRSIKGCERAHILRPGYSIEYDYFDPCALKSTLETKAIRGLFFAGQINGTTGYEEAAAQGLLAGINAGRLVRGDEGWSPRRDEAYLGVLVDDLITRGVTEPYRMFTSRAEYRLQLREDNADLRLTERGRELGVVDDGRWDAFSRKRDAVARELARLESTGVNPAAVAVPDAVRVLGQPIEREYSLSELLRRPGVTYAALMSLPGAGDAVTDPVVAEQVEVSTKYAGYIDRQREEIERHRAQEIAAASAGSRLPHGARLLGRGAAQAQPAQARDARAGGPDLGDHAGGHLAAARASEARARDAVGGRVIGALDLDEGLSQLDALGGTRSSLPPGARDRLAAYLDLLAKWNRTYNLTAIREPERMVTHHVLDALAVLPHLPGELAHPRTARARRRQRLRRAGDTARDRASRLAGRRPRQQPQEGRLPATGGDRAGARQRRGGDRPRRGLRAAGGVRCRHLARVLGSRDVCRGGRAASCRCGTARGDERRVSG